MHSSKRIEWTKRTTRGAEFRNNKGDYRAGQAETNRNKKRQLNAQSPITAHTGPTHTPFGTGRYNTKSRYFRSDIDTTTQQQSHTRLWETKKGANKPIEIKTKNKQSPSPHKTRTSKLQTQTTSPKHRGHDNSTPSGEKATNQNSTIRLNKC